MSPESTNSLTSALCCEARWTGESSFTSVSCPSRRVLAQGLAQRLILHAPTPGHVWGIGGQKREGAVRIAAILRQVKTDPAHLMPLRGPPFKKPRQPPLGRGHLAAHPGVQVVPEARKGVLGHISAPGIGGTQSSSDASSAEVGREIGPAPTPRSAACGTARSVAGRQGPPIGKRGGQRALEPLRGQREKPYSQGRTRTPRTPF